LMVVVTGIYVFWPKPGSAYEGASGEPECHRTAALLPPRTWDCAGRELYRAIHATTSEPSVGNVQAAMLDVYAPLAAKNEWLQQYLDGVYPLVVEENAACHRDM